MTSCDFETIGENIRCKRCGFTVRNPGIPPFRACSEPQDAAVDLRLPSALRMAWNLAKALLEFVADGCRTVTREQYEERLRICDGCELLLRDQWRCTHSSCGCFLKAKVMGRVWKCPLGKWPEVPNASD
jgi:hypothetical protein